MSFHEWRDHTAALREKLKSAAIAQNVPWDSVLEVSRRAGRDPARMRQWVLEHGFDVQLAQEIADYGWLLTLADYLPLDAKAIFPKYDLFIAQPPTGKSLLITDIKGLGVINRKAQDEWFRSGADLDNLESAHKPGLVLIAQIINTLSKKIRAIDPNAAIQYYVSGDSIVFDLPPLDHKNRIELQNWLLRLDVVYSAIQPILEPTAAEKSRAVEAGAIRVNAIKRGMVDAVADEAKPPKLAPINLGECSQLLIAI